jgi:N-acetyl-gamma-glutamyl-phosphate reductase
LFLGDKNFMKTVAIIGASGYGGGELVRLLSRHPHVKLAQVITDTFAGKPLATAFPGLHKTSAGALICEAKTAEINADIVFLAQENGYAKTVAGAYLAEGKKVIDLSADFRLKDTEIYTEFYKMPATESKLLAQAVYGLPEKYREQIKNASLIANPGCHTTTAILPLFPLIANNIIAKTPIIIDSKTGVSGAGRAKSDTIYRFSEMNETVRPYSVGGSHRHIPEIAQEIGADVAFTPHLIPMTRGILSTIYAPLSAGQTLESLYDTWHKQYENEPFVVVREPGDWPSTKDVEGSNFCHICATVDTKLNLAVLVSVTDNLMKGAAGQAVQNMNIMEGFDETVGLQGGGLWP